MRKQLFTILILLCTVVLLTACFKNGESIDAGKKIAQNEINTENAFGQKPQKNANDANRNNFVQHTLYEVIRGNGAGQEANNELQYNDKSITEHRQTGCSGTVHSDHNLKVLSFIVLPHYITRVVSVEISRLIQTLRSYSIAQIGNQAHILYRDL